jgi:hypothetical protein
MRTQRVTKPGLLALLVFLLLVPTARGAQEINEEECIRAEAARWVDEKHAEVENASFTRHSLLTSTERVFLRSGEVLTIKHGGCEYFFVTVRHDFRGRVPAKPGPAYWFRKGAAVLRLLHGLLPEQTNFDLETDAAALIKEAGKEPKLRWEYPVEGDGISFLQTRVVLEAAGTTEGGGFVEVQLYKGPL